MTERPGNLSEGSYALQTWRTRPGVDVRHWGPYLPELHVTIGRDDRSSGMTVTVWEPTGGEFASYRTLWSVRWQSPVMSTQEALEICYRGVAAAIAELFEDGEES